jgi:hypothetical protein
MLSRRKPEVGPFAGALASPRGRALSHAMLER